MTFLNKSVFPTLAGVFLLLQAASGQEAPARQDSDHDLVYESGGELLYEEAAYDVFHYDLDLKVNPADSSIAGTVTMSAKIVHPTDRIVLDLDPRLKIDSIREVSGQAPRDLDFFTDGTRRIRLQFPDTLQPGGKLNIAVTYSGRPRLARNPPWDGGFVWSRTPSGKPWVGVTTQTAGSWIWWPGKSHPSDKPDSVTVRFTLPDDLTVVSNGRLRGASPAGEGWKTWHWFNSNPISNYNITLNVAPYVHLTDPYESMTGECPAIHFWVLPEFRRQGERLLVEFQEQFRFLEELLGPYPFRADKYAMVHAPYLGMEHQSAIAYGADFRNDNLYGAGAGFDDLLQHELSHEWWGNMVSVWDWRDFWIHEGFGTYMQALYAEHLGGKAAYRRMMAAFLPRINSRMEIVPRETRTSKEIYSHGNDLYFKGAWFLHTLRYVMGDELFFQSLRRFAYPDPALEEVTDGSQVRFVSTEDYRSLVNELAGQDLGWLFDLYLHRPELPRLVVRREETELSLEWVVPPGTRFPMPVDVVVDGERRILHPEDGTTIQVPAGAQIEVDPDRWILIGALQWE